MTLRIPNYEESAQYILDEIKKAGLQSPRRIVRLTEHLYHLTKFAAMAQDMADERDIILDPGETIPRLRRPMGGGDIPPPVHALHRRCFNCGVYLDPLPRDTSCSSCGKLQPDARNDA